MNTIETAGNTQAEGSEPSGENLDTNEVMGYISEKEEYIDTATIELEKENEALISLDNIKRYIQKELKILDFKTKVFANDVTKYFKENFKWSRVGVTASTVGLLWSMACTSTPVSSVVSAPEGEPEPPIATEGIIEEEALESVKTPEAVSEVVSETGSKVVFLEGDASAEEKENLLAGYDNSWTYEEIDKIVPEYQGIERSVNANREKRYPDKAFYYFIFTEKRGVFFGGNSPYDSYSNKSFAEMGGYTQQEMEDYGLAYEDEIISNVLSAITRRYITEGWDSNEHYDTVVFVTVDESGRNCFWLKDGGFLRIYPDKSIDYVLLSEEEELLNHEIVEANSGFSTFDYTTEDIFRCNIEEELGLDFVKAEEPTPTPSE